jgi:hypothetical protein
MISVNLLNTFGLSTDHTVSTAFSSQEYLIRNGYSKMSLRRNSLVLAEGVEEVAHLPALVRRMVVKHHDQPLLKALGLDAGL